MELAQKQTKKEFFNSDYFRNFYIARMFFAYCVLPVSAVVISSFFAINSRGIFYICICSVYLAIFAIAKIIVHKKRQKAEEEIYKELGIPIKHYKWCDEYKSYNELEEKILENAKNIDFKTIRFPYYSKDNPQSFVKIDIFKIYLKYIFEAYLKYLYENIPDDELIQKLSSLEFSNNEKQSIKNLFITERIKSFSNLLFEQCTFISLKDTLSKLEKYSDIHKKDKDIKEKLSFKIESIDYITKTIKSLVYSNDLDIAYIGGLCLYLIIILFCEICQTPASALVIITAFATIFIIFVVAVLIFCIYFICKSVVLEQNIFEIAKYLPITSEEFKKLNIKNYADAEVFITNLFADKIKGAPHYSDCNCIYDGTLQELIEKSLEIYLLENCKEEIIRKISENSFNTFVLNTNKYEEFNLLEDFAFERANIIVEFLTDDSKDITPFEKTLDSLIVTYRAEKAKAKVLEENGQLIITDSLINK